MSAPFNPKRDTPQEIVRRGAGVIAGRHAVLEALRAGRRRIDRILLQAGGGGGILKELRSAAEAQGVPLEEVQAARLDRVAAGAVHQGVVALAALAGDVEIQDLLDRAAEADEPPFLIALDELKDPQNVGAIIRTAEGAGAHGLVTTRHRSAPVGKGAERASAGAVEHLPIATVANLREALIKLKDAGCRIVGAEMEGSALYTTTDFTGPLVLVMGEEENGLRDLTKKTCDELVRIPLRGRIGSLNVSASAAILCYEVVRQREGAAR